ncbi:hypothetical protein [Lactobacillus bombicola]|uniref:DUF4767 domain-containing protein n=1 Tax=Lactobacillus bombicola TaxID=1505723 RepID=A0ABX9LU42_9LACO|nr:hypothetical protein [Lactobacillus bombicola]RHW50710.1 hypothetical protein DS834_05365 [Lactobacillus bombicola]RHW51555.1 hypothetical protein DS833_01835 [Lactobacillus bombicola]
MKLKNILTSMIVILGLGFCTVTAVCNNNQTVSASTVSHTIPKKFRGKWYEKGYGQYYIVQYTENTQAKFTDQTNKNLINGLQQPVSVKKAGKNKCDVWTSSDIYKTHLSVRNINYNGKKYKMLSYKYGKNPALYYFNHKINRFYSARRGFIQ